MSPRPIVQMRSAAKKLEQARCERGYQDGYAGRVASSVDYTYQQAWRRGREAFYRDQTEA